MNKLLIATAIASEKIDIYIYNMIMVYKNVPQTISRLTPIWGKRSFVMMCKEN